MPCSLSPNEEGVCVYAYLCPNGVINTDGEGLLDLRMGDICEDYFLRCCSKESACAENNGKCVSIEKCGVDLNEPKYKLFKKSDECDWSGYKCCPTKYVGQKKTPISPPKLEPETCNNNGVCVPHDQCLVNPDGISIIEARHADCSNADHTCCPTDKVKSNLDSDVCNSVGGKCVPQNQCSSLLTINVRISQCELPGYVCCTGDGTNSTSAASSGKPCFNGNGKCTSRNTCRSTTYRDRKGECNGLVCCATVTEPGQQTPKPVRTTTESTSSIIDSSAPATDRVICNDIGGLCLSAQECITTAGEMYEECENEEKVCCLRQSTTTEKWTTIDPLKPKPMNNNYTPRGCGYRNEGGVGFNTIGGSEGESQYGEFPWMVAILTGTGSGTKFVCGGALIDPEVILTTADCVKSFRRKPETLIVRAGEWDMGSLKEPIPHEERFVRLVKVHPAFKPTSLVNNVALLFLDDKFDLGDTIEPVCLPPNDFTISNGHVVATGWGTTPTNRNKYQQILKSLELPYTHRSDCERVLRKMTRNSRFSLDDSFMCAGGDSEVDTCQGDAGSPIVYAIPDDLQYRVYAVGMVSWGVGCGRPGVPAAYTNVAKFRDWIDEQMTQEDVTVYYYMYYRESPDDNDGGRN
ncbi:phenoloxidase-activating factor 2-like [Topomyia yanbarensis]|uniref:phenoloxidase-activating factor 2-like n=1 Tax=Topomyia yanbarensis TaxID=2498891 RepID=UPI00273B10A9|nr:phenoloxidase-activating factor 2-like [Topomyia yanbarensis]